jgi:selenocysteine-specific elongation factor
MRRLILGTAGHIDHGKTTLVKALTGVDTDRLPEEKARGITIDLGFAHLQIGELDIGIVDVPGHEGLIRNMLAGATGFDAVLLVVAADEGVMPQTREHVAIARLLGVRDMIVALTKADVVDEEWLELVRSDVEAFVRAAFPNARVIPVSARTGQGMEELRVALTEHLAHASQRREADVFRLPVDRVFTVRGTGTVVTGTVWSGQGSRQEALRLLPVDREVRVRGVQTHGSAVDSAVAGERAAFALVGVDREEVARGDVLVNGSAWRAVWVLTARAELLAHVLLKQRQRVRVHLGTAEVLARVVMLDAVWIQLRLEHPLVARAGDRFVLRSYSPVATIGGGQVGELGRARKSLNIRARAALEQILDGSAPLRIRAAIELSGVAGCSAEELPLAAGVTPAEVMLFATSPPDDVAYLDDRFYLASLLEEAVQRICGAVRVYHERHPLDAGADRAGILAGGGALVVHALMAAVGRGLLAHRGALIAAAGFEPGFSERQLALRNQLAEQLRKARLTPPSVGELTAEHRSNEVRAVLRLMEARGDVVAVHQDWFIDRQVLTEALDSVRRLLGRGAFPAGEFKTALPVSRKYLIPLLEYMDRIGLTVREGDLRRVMPAEHTETA